MHRTQIYLQDALYDRLKHQSQIVGVSISELIRKAVDKDLNQYEAHRASLFFESLKPLQSFANTDSEQYVDELRRSSRILQDTPITAAE
ncbi:MAG: ribbon-helix-helix domain-containing protein [Gallionella sp.]|nr:ribbon-helix-helix domain-containing protein [Gallionella sp.]